jgi:hypothetical protein
MPAARAAREHEAAGGAATSWGQQYGGLGWVVISFGIKVGFCRL